MLELVNEVKLAEPPSLGILRLRSRPRISGITRADHHAWVLDIELQVLTLPWQAH